MEEIVLAPCPHCGASARLVALHNGYTIVCNNANCFGMMQIRFGSYDNKDIFLQKLISDWNRRVPEIKAVIEAIRCVRKYRDNIYDESQEPYDEHGSCCIDVLDEAINILECHIVWAPIETCIERDSKRERTVGKEVIDRMLKRFQAPYYDEGFDSIEIFRPDYFDAEIYTENIVTSNKIPHDNPHHTYPVDEHCRAAGDYLYSRINSVGGNSKEWQLVKAAYSHDIGKGYTKSFKDTKGNITEIAHYYQHQCVGAWMSYGVSYYTTPYIAWLISTHMEPFFKSKYYLNLPPFLKKDIDLLHEADLNAH